MATNREEVSELVKQSETLTKIRFLFELPAELKLKIEAKDFIGAVDDYQRANDVLVNYKNHPSFQSIQDVSYVQIPHGQYMDNDHSYHAPHFIIILGM